MVDEVMEGVKEPVGENRVVVEEKVAVFDGMRNLRFHQSLWRSDGKTPTLLQVSE
jgi:hypothetical protein